MIDQPAPGQSHVEIVAIVDGFYRDVFHVFTGDESEAIEAARKAMQSWGTVPKTVACSALVMKIKSGR